jgi:hypothetical protein
VADSQRQGQDRHRGKAGTPPELTQSISKVLHGVGWGTGRWPAYRQHVVDRHRRWEVLSTVAPAWSRRSITPGNRRRDGSVTRQLWIVQPSGVLWNFGSQMFTG